MYAESFVCLDGNSGRPLPYFAWCPLYPYDIGTLVDWWLGKAIIEFLLNLSSQNKIQKIGKEKEEIVGIYSVFTDQHHRLCSLPIPRWILQDMVDHYVDTLWESIKRDFGPNVRWVWPYLDHCLTDTEERYANSNQCGGMT